MGFYNFTGFILLVILIILLIISIVVGFYKYFTADGLNNKNIWLWMLIITVSLLIFTLCVYPEMLMNMITTLKYV